MPLNTTLNSPCPSSEMPMITIIAPVILLIHSIVLILKFLRKRLSSHDTLNQYDTEPTLTERMIKSDPNIVKYLGITLLPQAGVALGMAIKAIELGPDGAIVRNITLFAVLIYEIVGPFLTKIALTKAGDIKEEGRRSAREEHLAKKVQK